MWIPPPRPWVWSLICVIFLSLQSVALSNIAEEALLDLAMLASHFPPFHFILQQADLITALYKKHADSWLPACTFIRFLCLNCLPSSAYLENSKLYLPIFHSGISFSRKFFLAWLIPVRINHIIIFMAYFVFSLL